jgi:hypothetical protein
MPGSAGRCPAAALHRLFCAAGLPQRGEKIIEAHLAGRAIAFQRQRCAATPIPAVLINHQSNWPKAPQSA